MIYWIIGGVIAFLFFAIAFGKDEGKTDSKSRGISGSQLNINDLVNDVKSIEDLKKLRNRYKQSERSLSNSQSADISRIGDRYQTHSHRKC